MKKLFAEKIIAVLMCVCMIFSCSAAFALEIETFGAYGDFEYSVENGEITITRCKEEAMGEIIIPQNIDSMPVTAIGESAFEFCTEITKVEIPDTIKTIGSYAFVYCWSLESIEIPDSVISIEASAFEGCTALKTVHLGKNLSSLKNAFLGCDMLKSITVSSENEAFLSRDGVLYSKDGKILITYPANKAEDAKVEEGTEKIAASAFEYCSKIKSVTVPKSVTEIGNNAFYGCAQLESAVFEGEAPKMGESVFDNVAEGFAITYDSAYSSSWAPNGETSFNSYPLNTVVNTASNLKLKEDSTLTVNNSVIMGVDGGTTVSELLLQFEETGGVCVVNKNGEAVALDEPVGTDYKVNLVIDGEVKQSLTIAVTGDVTGDGKVNSRDIASLQRHVTEVPLLGGAALLAGDRNSDNDINSRDLARVQRIVSA